MSLHIRHFGVTKRLEEAYEKIIVEERMIMLNSNNNKNVAT
jgi:hypothetical protein